MKQTVFESHILKLKDFKDVPKQDNYFIERLREKLDELLNHHSDDAENNLDTFLTDIFRQRREQLKHTEYDYLKSKSEYTLSWIALCKELAQSLDKPYVQILMPDIRNLNGEEYFSNQRLEDFSDLTTLMISDDDLLFSPKSIYQRHLKAKQKETIEPFYLLSLTQQEGVSGTVSQYKNRPWSLQEIARFRKHPTDREGQEPYSSYWVELVSSAFLSSYSKLELSDKLIAQLYMLNKLLSMNDNQYQMLFQHALIQFSNDLRTRYGYDEVNRFYSEVIILDGQRTPLVELLVQGLRPRIDGIQQIYQAISSHFQARFSSIEKERHLQVQTVFAVLELTERYFKENSADKLSLGFFKELPGPFAKFKENNFRHLPNEEQQKLLNYHIFKKHSSKNWYLCRSFEDVFNQSTGTLNMVALYGYYAKLILDFMPWYCFENHFENSCEGIDLDDTLTFQAFKPTDDLGNSLKTPLLDSIERLNLNNLSRFLRNLFTCPQTKEAFALMSEEEREKITKKMSVLFTEDIQLANGENSLFREYADKWENHTGIKLSVSETYDKSPGF